jgi:hypothetical protein
MTMLAGNGQRHDLIVRLGDHSTHVFDAQVGYLEVNDSLEAFQVSSLGCFIDQVTEVGFGEV